MSLKIPNHIVSVDWLYQNLEDENLIILNATLPKVATRKESQLKENQIVGAVFFDIKNIFSDTSAAFPNTVLSSKKFQEEAQKLGIQKDSTLIVYDNFGIYSSPRVWWLFQLMGFQNIAVLDGGFPAWKNKNFPIEKPIIHQLKKGNFKANYNPHKIKFTKDVFTDIENIRSILLDARSKDRFYGTTPEPRKNVKSGHIPNSKNLPYEVLLENGKFKSENELEEIFIQLNPDKKNMIFSCGTGITASILALGAELAGYKNTAVYDGSWTEWGSVEGLPIEKEHCIN